MQLGLSPKDRLNEDLQKRITEELKAEIKDHVNNKYQDLEDMLNRNLPPNAIRTLDLDGVGSLEAPAADGPQTERVVLKQPPPIKKSVLQYNPMPPKKTVPQNFDFQTAKRG